MCGFAGARQREPIAAERLEQTARVMQAALRHRGPDMTGQWLEPTGRALFAFNRLAIQDLSPAANQPMHSESGRFTLVYNGEIYNCDELRQWIGRSAASFRTHSDTEVLLACFETHGLEATLQRANGMFALALWDAASASLLLARDRMGKKPLHYEMQPGSISFASEIKALLRAAPHSRSTSSEAVRAFFSLTYVPAPLSIFEGIRKVRPGHILEVDRNWNVREWPYWSLRSVLEARERGAPAREEIMQHADALLEDAVRRRLISDVPVAVLLSGGVDSSLVAYMVARRLHAPLRAFTIEVEDAALDESAQARAIARAIGIENVALRLSRADALAWVDKALDSLDEPLGDPSTVPTYAVCRLARQHATVLLTGDGGDEVFGGYTRYPWAAGWRGMAARLYGGLRRRKPWLGREELALEVYRRLMTTGSAGGSLAPESLAALAGGLRLPRHCGVLDLLRYLDFQLYLPDDILVKTDRTSMASSAELRSPFLDYRLVEWSWQLPERELMRGGERKRITRELFARRIGEPLLQTTKHGFALPIADWLAGPLRDQLATAVEELPRRGDLPPHVALTSWQQEFRRGRRRQAQFLWPAFAFWRWAQRWEKDTTWRQAQSA